MPRAFLLRGPSGRTPPTRTRVGPGQGRPGEPGATGEAHCITTGPNRLARLDPAAQDLGHAPGLGHASAWRIGLLGVEDLADRADAAVSQVGQEPLQEPAGAARLPGVELEPGVHER